MLIAHGHDSQLTGIISPIEDINVIAAVYLATEDCLGLSGLGVLAIIVTFYLSPRFRNPLHRLIFINAFYTLFDAGSLLISRDGPDAGDASALCQSQAFLNQMCVVILSAT